MLKFSDLKKFYLRLRAMQLSVKSKPKIFLPTPRYALLRGVTNICEFAANSQPYAKMIYAINH
jgi:hypothetical protein